MFKKKNIIYYDTSLIDANKLIRMMYQRMINLGTVIEAISDEWAAGKGYLINFNSHEMNTERDICQHYMTFMSKHDKKKKSEMRM